jgi:hypothetical protein
MLLSTNGRHRLLWGDSHTRPVPGFFRFSQPSSLISAQRGTDEMFFIADKTIKLWKIYEKAMHTVTNLNSRTEEGSPLPRKIIKDANDLRVPQVCTC